MRIAGVEKPLIAELEHFGVKGMHWGVRKQRSPSEQRRVELAKARRKMEKQDTNVYMLGVNYRGSALKKMYKKAVKKNPDFAYGKLSPEAKAAWNKKADRKVIRKIALMGAAETGIILAGGHLAVKNLGKSPRAIQGARVGTAMLAAQVAKIRIQEINAVRSVKKVDDLRDRIHELERGGNNARRG